MEDRMVNQRGPQYFHEWAPVLTITLLYFYFIPTFNDSLFLFLSSLNALYQLEKGEKGDQRKGNYMF